uniref:Uncharacterized protein n=1 Tax=Anguilla anguilla TaxID=7936 RepID=A0A0E9SGY6_ANGAN
MIQGKSKRDEKKLMECISLYKAICKALGLHEPQ